MKICKYQNECIHYNSLYCTEVKEWYTITLNWIQSCSISKSFKYDTETELIEEYKCNNKILMINNNNVTKYVVLIEYCEIEGKFNINYLINIYHEII